MPPELPDYGVPPLVEVVLGVQFEQLHGMGAVHYGCLWEAFREDFPRWEEKSPPAPAFELPRSGGSPHMSVRVELGGAMLPRLWMLNDNDTRLIQVQPDRLVVNWRKVGGDDVYPRYEAIREQFTEVVDKFSAFLAEQGLDELRANQCPAALDELHAQAALADARFGNDTHDLSVSRDRVLQRFVQAVLSVELLSTKIISKF